MVDGPELAAAVLHVLASPPADGMLLFRPSPEASAAGFEAGDVVLSIDQIPTTDHASLQAACAARAVGPVPHEVIRGETHSTVDAGRFVVAQAGPLAVRRHVAVEARPEASADLDARNLGAGIEIAGERVSGGARSKRGFERHRVVSTGTAVELRSDAAFMEQVDAFGYTALSTLTVDRRVRLSSFSWRDPVRYAEVTAAVMATRVVLEAQGPSGPARITHPVSAELVPSLFVQLAACLLPRRAGAAAHVSPLPEDGYPWWSVGGSHAFAPLDPHRLPKTVVCQGRAPLRIGRLNQTAWRFDAIALGRTWCTTWLDDDGGVLAIERPGDALVPADPAIVRAGLIDLRA